MTEVRLKYVQAFIDRHGHQRFYYRRNGRTATLPKDPSSAAFLAAYAAAEAALASPDRPDRPDRPIPAAGTFTALATLYFDSVNFRGLSPSSRRNYRRVIDSFLHVHGHGRLDQLKREHIIKITGAMFDRPGAAIIMLKRIRTLVRFAVDLGWIAFDPTARIRTFKSKEIHTWTELEITQFKDRWPVGTRQRLAFDILLFTGQRGSDAHRMVRPDQSGKIRIVQQKTGTALSITAHPELIVSLTEVDARVPATDRHRLILATAYGRSFSVKGFGQFVSAAIRQAGLPPKCKAHGLRKASARRLAEVGCSANEIMAVTGHKTLAEVERYVRAAEQSWLNERAMRKQLENGRVSTLPPENDNPIDIVEEK